MFFAGRYILFLMGAFSIYTGLIYNDVFSKSINIFGSSWYPSKQLYGNMDLSYYKLNPNNTCFNPSGPYPFGLDPVWQLTQNKITITNSLKMKISVIFGISHMMFGLSLSLINHRYFKKPLNIFCEFIPQLIFLVSIFGYLIILIFIKWIKFTEKDSQSAPNLLIGLINMFLMTYPTHGSKSNMTFYDGQKGFQIFLVVLALLCVPWMLCVKPYLMYKSNKNGQTEAKYTLLNGPSADSDVPEVVHAEDDDHELYHHEEPQEKPFDLGEVIIGQAIHTIEYCLGCISHTASYLRLWALSLAHAQLSEVLWGMVMQIALSMKNPVLSVLLIIPCFAFWACTTVIILVLMEGMSAFLHALRLHWVEFQSKFYHGEGYLFVPFSFDNLLEYGLDETVHTGPRPTH